MVKHVIEEDCINRNGIIKWALGIMLTILILTASLTTWETTVSATRAANAVDKVEECKVKMHNINMDMKTHIAAQLEVDKAMKEQLDTLKIQMDAVEAKLEEVRIIVSKLQ